ncbi:MAG: low specificity L-threonine aldolase [Burkholderiales bacterium]|nr:low specificity L-threonine aldolase [Burkholderiales bacterium]
MTTPEIDLRSDTVTRPTPEMLAAMAHASLGDDSRDGDPTVERLEDLAALRCGKQAGLFLPSGTMANLVAILAHTGRAGEVLMEANSHTLTSELGGIGALAGLFTRPLPGYRGTPDFDALRAAVRRPGIGRSKVGTALIQLETSHNHAGGAVLPLAQMAAIRGLSLQHNVPVHVDGARLFNAATALGVGVDVIAQHADSVNFCLSKGLSAPIGSMLCGSSEFIENARGYRRMVGGNLRQAGPLAAAGILAIEKMSLRLAEDHATARQLADGLAELDSNLVDPAAIETNIVRIDVSKSPLDAETWERRLGAAGIRVGAYGAERQLRLVTHRHVDAAAIDHVLQQVRKMLQR